MDLRLNVINRMDSVCDVKWNVPSVVVQMWGKEGSIVAMKPTVRIVVIGGATTIHLCLREKGYCVKGST